ncbi:hypothetical protein L226DRAFT_486174 [Lentinus tigrinus ALCF2SS1-7]|uniref:Uncharacterized protein n=1 Tax=Lentinus tigrinus ALCF2SS1-6 TaxID=1328759 RepID=A0A5C2SBE2_9APHY|nr:hypothetical protein L227DRAFT_652855 [Lentinus tigrinus ALCF2SS1-6]RPD75153.1 hypothetical protein L226DRAFT_486174 [Lentinus tigrinus ALCF2SS1-7]
MSTKKEAASFGVSSRTQLELKGLLAEQQQEVARNKAAGQTRLIGGVKRPDKKIPKWMKPNPGVHGRAARDTELEEIPRASLDDSLAILEQKAVRYNETMSGKGLGLDDNQIANSLVDFEQKRETYHSDSDDVDESLFVPVRPQDDDDPIMEYEDEYGRTRTARRSEIPREYLHQQEEEREEDFDPLRIVNPVNYFPTHIPTEERKQEVEERFAEENNPIETHFDSTREVRDFGAAHYKFSKNEEIRKAQMKSLAEINQETQQGRALHNAPDVPAGSVVGMQGEPESAKSRAVEKRKRLLEERNKQLEAKRKKRKAQEEPTVPQDAPVAGPSNASPPPATPANNDPFAALEAQAKNKSTQTLKQEANAADDFLAKLEQEVLPKQRAH